MIRVQAEDFDVGRELEKLSDGNLDVGGVSCFIGLVRDMAGDKPVKTMTLEHYPEMTEKALAEIEAEARQRWPLSDTLIIHRYGELAPGWAQHDSAFRWPHPCSDSSLRRRHANLAFVA